MRYEIIQTRPYPDAAFEIRRNGALIGGAARLPRKKGVTRPNTRSVSRTKLISSYV